jgi:hypothetical protein
LLLHEEADVAEIHLMSSLVDYGWLSDPARPVTSTFEESYPDLDIDGWVGMNEIDHQNNDPRSEQRSRSEGFSSSNEVEPRNGHDDDTDHQPLDFFTGDPWPELIDQVNLNTDATKNKAWESPWSSALM